MIVSDIWKKFPNFKPNEFACGCGCQKEVWDMDENLLWILQAVRNKYGLVKITSGYRCQKYNDSLKGSVKDSYHIKKKAADFYIAGRTETEAGREEIIAFMSKLPGFKYAYHNKGGKYPNMGSAVHVEVK